MGHFDWPIIKKKKKLYASLSPHPPQIFFNVLHYIEMNTFTSFYTYIFASCVIQLH